MDIYLWYVLVSMRNYTIIPNDSYFYFLHHILILIYKPFIIGPVLFLILKKKCKLYFSMLDTLLILMLIYQVGLLIEIIINSFINYSIDIDLIFKMSGNNTGNNISSSEGRNNDLARLIRYLFANVAALLAKRPMSKAIGLTIANVGNILADVASDEARANYWINQYNFYMANGRLRGGQSGSGPFERYTNFLVNTDNMGKSDTSNYLPDLSLFKDLFAPVEHSIPLDTLQNIHTIMTLGLFVLVFCTVLLLIYFFFNLLILFNKDFLLNRVKNKYAVLYIKYVLFKSRVDILVIGLLIIGTLCFVLYILHYLIVHPIIVNT
uniref:hypothetical protein n=1 Tax=Trametes meyenii TaxID=526243 RepID=UPI003001A6DC|nr:hypothetical protein [Trametes meyenii]